MNLLQNVTSTVNEVCKRLKHGNPASGSAAAGSALSITGNYGANPIIKSGRVIPTAVSAVKNGRRKMEDRHVVIHDLNQIYGDVVPNVSPPINI